MEPDVPALAASADALAALCRRIFRPARGAGSPVRPAGRPPYLARAEEPFHPCADRALAATSLSAGMMAGDAAKYRWDAWRAAERIRRFTAGRDRATYPADDLPRSAVERQFEIGGEALAGLRRVDPDLAAAIPDLPRIIAFRNVPIHGYATVDDELAWGVWSRGRCPGCRPPSPVCWTTRPTDREPAPSSLRRGEAGQRVASALRACVRITGPQALLRQPPLPAWRGGRGGHPMPPAGVPRSVGREQTTPARASLQARSRTAV